MHFDILDPALGINETVDIANGGNYVINVTAPIPGAPDPYINVVEVWAYFDDFPNVLYDWDDHEVELFQPAVQVVKDGDTEVCVGDTITYNFTITNTSSADTPDLILDSVIDDVLGDLTALAFAAGGDVLTDGEIVNFSTTRAALDTDPSPLVNVVTVLYHPEGFPNDVTDDDDHSVIVWICLDTTAWAAQGNPGQTRFIPDQGDWATWITYNVEDGSDVEPWEYPLFTGQTHRSGTLYVYDEGGMLYVKYSIDGQDPEYIEGYDGEWIGLSKYHLQVVDEFAGFSPYLTKKGGAIPGQFDLSGSLDKDPETDWIGVDISSYGDDDIYIAAHAIMWWLGVPE